MKRFVLKISIIGFILVLLFLSMEMFVRFIPNEYSYKARFLENNIEKINVLVLGSSVGRSGIDPKCFDYNTFNTANVSQDLETDCAIIDKYIERAPNLRAVIFAMLPMSYTYKMKEGIESWLLRRYHIYYELNVDWPKVNESLEITNLSGCIGRITNFILGEETIDCKKNGMGNDSILEPESIKMKQGVETAHMHNSLHNRANYSSITSKLVNTISVCKQRNVKVLLVLMPTCESYYNNIDPFALREFEDISRILENKYTNVRYLNLLKDSTYNSDDFRNSNHLSQKGAKKLSKQLNCLLKK